MRHFSRWPVRAAACGVLGERLTSELDLVECAACRAVVLRAEIRGERLSA